jgi:CheY-like chemotaxis protein
MPLSVAADATLPRSARVLLVANDSRSLQSYAARLEEAGIRTSTARTGFEAIVKACWHLPDVILMQDGLAAGEGVDGSVAAQMIRVCPATSHIAVVDGDSVDRLHCAGMSAHEFPLIAQIARELSGR